MESFSTKLVKYVKTNLMNLKDILDNMGISILYMSLAINLSKKLCNVSKSVIIRNGGGGGLYSQLRSFNDLNVHSIVLLFSTSTATTRVFGKTNDEISFLKFFLCFFNEG